MNPQPRIWCESLTCDMSVRACEVNQALAHLAILKLTEEWQETRGKDRKWLKTFKPVGLHQLSNQEVNRFLVCGQCDRSSIDPQVVSKLFREGMDALIHKITVYREYGFDREVSHIRTLARGKRYRQDHAEEIRARREEKALEILIRKLREASRAK